APDDTGRITSPSGSTTLSVRLEEDRRPVLAVGSITEVKTKTDLSVTTVFDDRPMLRTLQPVTDDFGRIILSSGDGFSGETVAADPCPVQALAQGDAGGVDVTEESLLAHLARIGFGHAGTGMVPPQRSATERSPVLIDDTGGFDRPGIHR